MKTIKVLGIGSPFGDDQVGWKVIEFLKNHLPLSEHITLGQHDRPGARLLELMEGANTVYLIDAIKSGHPLGTIHCFENTEIFTIENHLSTHDLGLAQALQLAKALDVLPEHVILFGIEIDTIRLDASISKPVLKSIKKVVVELKKILTQSKVHCH